MVNYDEQDGNDTAGAMETACRNLTRFEFDINDLDFSFNQVEIKMQAAGVKKNFTKMQILSTILPKQIIEEVKSLLRKKEDDFPDKDGYLKLKKQIIRIFGPPANANFERAMSRVMTGKPSQLGNKIIEDMCEHEMDGCCCYKWVYGLWMRALPSFVKHGIASYGFDSDNYLDIFQRADDIFTSDKPANYKVTTQIAAMQMTAPQQPQQTNNPLDEGFHQDFGMNQDASVIAGLQARGRGQIRVVGSRGRGQRGGRGQPRGQRGNRGGRGQGGQSTSGHPRHNTPRHEDQPPIQACWRHWTYGKSAHFCQEPGTCPWKDTWLPKSNQ